MPYGPVGIVLVRALDDAALDDAVVEQIEPDPLVRPGDHAELLGLRQPEPHRLVVLLPHAPVAVQPLQVHRVQRVLLALQPVAGQRRERDLAPDVVPRERLPHREERCGLRAHVREHHAPEHLDRVGRDLHLLLEAPVRVDGLLERLLDALAGLVHHPAVVHAAEAVLLRDAVGEVDAAVRAEPLDEADRAGLVPVEDEVLAEDAHRLRGTFVELADGGDGVPVAAHQLAHGRARADSRQPFVLLDAEHALPPCAPFASVPLAGLYRTRQAEARVSFRTERNAYNPAIRLQEGAHATRPRR